MTELTEPLTLESALRVIAELRALVAQQAQTIAQQALRIADLEEKVRKDSSNSSKPPSSDGPAKKAYPPKKPSGRKRGGQPGHKKHARTLLSVETARTVTDVKPPSCAQCGTALTGDDPCPVRHQVVDLPPIAPLVDEWRLHALACDVCGEMTTAELPAGVPSLGYGPGVDAMVGQLAGEMRTSKRTTAETMTQVFGVPMSTGAVIDAQTRVSAALAAPCVEAVRHAQAQPRKNADESPWKQGQIRGYLWVCVTTLVTVFMIQASRAEAAARALLGKVVGVLGTDRYSGYAWWPKAWRQVCWAHLIRDFHAIAQRGGSSGELGTALGSEADRMFAWWQRVKGKELKRTTFQVYMRPVRKRVEALLREGQKDPHAKTAGTCKKMWEMRDAFWTFVMHEGVEPTNNAAEQALRFGVVWRKMCYGTKSQAGSEFVARILTVHATLRQQGRTMYSFLRAACLAHRVGTQAPSLLPASLT